MRNLQDFATPITRSLFQDACNLPAFFQNNLVNTARVVKVFHCDPQANIRVFYYQYLKLCFELQNEDYQLYIHKIEEIVNNKDFKFVFDKDDDIDIYNDLQFKRLIMEFFGILGQDDVTIEDALNQYSIMDTVFIYFFRALLILTSNTGTLDSHIDRFALLQFLGGYFGVKISVHDKCIKFVDTDIFVYEEDPNEVFMAYMDYQNEPYQNNPLQEILMVKPTLTVHEVVKLLPPQTSTPSSMVSQTETNKRGSTQINKSYIASQFVDYTTPTAFSNLSKKNNDVGIYGPKNFGRTATDQSKTIDQVKKNYLGKLPGILENMKIFAQNNRAISQQNNACIPNINDISYYKSSNLAKTSTNQRVDESSFKVKKQPEPAKNVSFNFKGDGISEQKYKVNSLPPSDGNWFSKHQFKADNQKQVYNYPFQSDLKIYSNIKKQFSYEPLIKQLNPQFPQPYAAQLPSQSKNPFNLNVSKQFTNSFIMEVMSQPYKSSVKGIRQRARNFRNSLFSYIK